MQQLSGIDAAFLFGETPNAPMHIGSVAIWDPSTAPDGVVRFKRIIKTMEERAHLAPYLRQRLFEVPFNTDFPYWVKDDAFDPEFHIRHIALPKPGDWRQLCILVSRIHSRPVDRSRPLWELYVIEGLDNVEGVPPGSFAMLSKTHHAALDGTSVVDIGNALCDPTPEIRQIPGAETWVPDKPPTPFELAASAFQNNLLKPQRYLEFMQKAMPIWTDALKNIADGKLRSAPEVPRTRFNGVVSPNRVFEGISLSLDTIREIKNVAGGTVNDVVLAICAGALRRYLEEKNELPEQSLVTQCPINVRDKSASAKGGNQVSSMSVALHTEIKDPKQRLLAICVETRGAKELANAIGAKVMTEMADFMPTTVAALGARVAAEQGLANYTQPAFNTVITNVPGSQKPVYSNGAQHVRGWGLGPIADGTGLFHSIGSYCGELNISITSCRKMMPDPARYAECLNESFAELEEAMLVKDASPVSAKKVAPSPAKAVAEKPLAKKAIPKQAAVKGEASSKKNAAKKTAAKKSAPKKKIAASLIKEKSIKNNAVKDQAVKNPPIKESATESKIDKPAVNASNIAESYLAEVTSGK